MSPPPTTEERGQPPILRPLPQRHWQFTGTPSSPPTPPSEAGEGARDSSEAPPSRSRSVLNLTSSTLFGIYSGPSGDDISQGTTPYGPGAMTPITPSTPSLADGRKISLGGIGALAERPELNREHVVKRKRATIFDLVSRSAVLFLMGFVYGELATRLHEQTTLVPVKMEGIDRHTWTYFLTWGAIGVLLGNALPVIDFHWGPRAGSQGSKEGHTPEGGGADWTIVVRGIGAFIGMAFAIRRLPWESSMQASLTLALANPALWYLVDRSATGFWTSTTVGTLGAAIVLGVNPEWVPSPTPAANATAHTYGIDTMAGFVSYESVAVSTWVASVFFCSCVCFGNIGRLLAGRS